MSLQVQIFLMFALFAYLSKSSPLYQVLTRPFGPGPLSFIVLVLDPRY